MHMSMAYMWRSEEICKNCFSPVLSGFQGLDTDHQVWQRAPFKLSHRDVLFFKLLSLLFFVFTVCMCVVYVCECVMNIHVCKYCRDQRLIPSIFLSHCLLRQSITEPGAPWLARLTDWEPPLSLLLPAHRFWGYKPRSLCLCGRYITNESISEAPSFVFDDILRRQFIRVVHRLNSPFYVLFFSFSLSCFPKIFLRSAHV